MELMIFWFVPELLLMGYVELRHLDLETLFPWSTTCLICVLSIPVG